ncbi:unnamed protein product [Schistocephalus solidus]|uniref:Charged multivesicular body protein 7 n=1 Tax=Schistocephalus solidus TaxID=70667 RepID=A0A183TDQ9_SCHSO|nr:unnamed protein product [Schistocephalus solidus]
MQPSFVLPPIWKNDDEMYRLMQRIKRPREIDPAGFEQKISFWSNLIDDYANCHRVVVVSENALKKLFSRTFPPDGAVLSPDCLHQVLNYKLENGTLKLADMDGLISKLAGLMYELAIRKPISWTWSYLYGSETNTYADERRYGSPDADLILPRSLGKFSEEFRRSLVSDLESLSSEHLVFIYEDFEMALSNFFTHELSRSFVEQSLLKEGYIKIENSADLKLVFLSKSPESSTGKNHGVDFSVFFATARLRLSARKISAEEQKLAKTIESLLTEIKKLLVAKRRKEALVLLKRKKQLEKARDQRLQQLANLEALELELDAAKDNRTVINALSTAGETLKGTTGGAEGVEEAERTMDDLAEIMEDNDAISRALASVSRETESDADLESELGELLADKTGPKSKAPSAASQAASHEEPSDAEVIRQLESLQVYDSSEPHPSSKAASAQ